MVEIHVVRRGFRFDGGGEVAAKSYVEALSSMFNVSVICEGAMTETPSCANNIAVTKRGLGRTAKYKNFVRSVERLATERGYFLHSHEFIPGSGVIRLGDGLHSSWVSKNNIKLNSIFDRFHRFKLEAECATLKHPSLQFAIVNSSMVARDLVSTHNFDPARIVLIRNIVRRDFVEMIPTKASNSKRLIFVGSGWKRKGLQFAFEALTQLPCHILDVYGRDSEENKYKKMVLALGISSRVRFHGAIPVTAETYQNAKALVHPAIYEPFPNVAIEALSQGVPVISTISSGTSDFSRDEGVWTVSDLSSNSISAAIEDMSSITSQQQGRFREHVLQYTETYLRKELEKLYSKVEERV